MSAALGVWDSLRTDAEALTEPAGRGVEPVELFEQGGRVLLVEGSCSSP
jgi:hypothetical protein